MAKEAPTLAVTLDDSADNVRTISNDILSLDFATPRGVQDVTGVDKSAMERLLLLADYSCTLNGVFNDGAAASHITLKDVATTAVVRDHTIVVSGQTLDVNVFPTDYALSRSTTGEFGWTAPLVLADGTAPSWS